MIIFYRKACCCVVVQLLTGNLNVLSVTITWSLAWWAWWRQPWCRRSPFSRQGRWRSRNTAGTAEWRRDKIVVLIALSGLEIIGSILWQNSSRECTASVDCYINILILFLDIIYETFLETHRISKKKKLYESLESFPCLVSSLDSRPISITFVNLGFLFIFRDVLYIYNADAFYCNYSNTKSTKTCNCFHLKLTRSNRRLRHLVVRRQPTNAHKSIFTVDALQTPSLTC